MQRFVYLSTRTSRLFQVVDVNHWKNSKALFDTLNTPVSTNIFTFKRALASKTSNTKETDTHPDLYKPSTNKQETHVADELKGHHQPIDTINTNTKNPLTGGKVWSAQNPDGVHVAPLNEAHSATIVAKSTQNKQGGHEKTVYNTKGKLNIADPFTTHAFQPEATSAQAAQAAAASAFQPFASDTPTATPLKSDVVFAPKISSNDLHSTPSSPTAHFETVVSKPSQQGPVKYETASKPKVFGGQDTSADTKKRPKQNPFDLKEKHKPTKAK